MTGDRTAFAPFCDHTDRFESGRIVEHRNLRQQVPVHAAHEHPHF